MKVPMTVLRVVTLGPALLVSFVLAVVVFALLPPALGLVLFLASAAVLGALALGKLEVVAIGLLTRSRPATEAEFRVMAPVLAELGGRGVDVGCLYLRRVQRPQTPVALAIGHRAVVITPGLVEGTYRGGVTGAEAVAVLAHAVGRRRVIRPRLEAAVLAATTPWRMVVATVLKPANRRRVGIWGLSRAHLLSPVFGATPSVSLGSTTPSAGRCR